MHNSQIKILISWHTNWFMAWDSLTCLIGFFFVLNGQQMKWPVLMDDTLLRKCVHVPIWHVLSSPIYLCSIYIRDGEKKALKEVAHHQRASFNISRGVNEFSFPTLPPPRHPSLNETNSNFKWCWSALRRVSEFSSKEKTSLSR